MAVGHDAAALGAIAASDAVQGHRQAVQVGCLEVDLGCPGSWPLENRAWFLALVGLLRPCLAPSEKLQAGFCQA